MILDGSHFLELGAVLNVDAPADALAGRAALLVQPERALGLGPLALGNLARVADADRGDQRDTVDVLNDALDMANEIVRGESQPATAMTRWSSVAGRSTSGSVL
jgi:hypothetical protein